MTTKDQVIAMAREAGFSNFAIPPEVADVFYRFATLVRNAALEDAKQKLLAEPVELIAKWKAADIIRNLKEPTT